VRVEQQQLKQWYGTLDELLAGKSQIEQALYLRLRDLFSLQVAVAFYALSHQVKRCLQVLPSSFTSLAGARVVN
jgi:hypothetical protein